MMRPKSALITIALLIFSGFWTYLTIVNIPSGPGATLGLHVPQTNAWIGYATIASVSWVLSVCTVLHLSRKNRRDWRRAGFDDSAIDIMAEKRGALSRLRILEELKDPNHRSYVSDATGIDWREVDREVRLMMDLGLVEMQTKQGRGELFGLTGKGIVALGLLETKLNGKNIEGGAREPRPNQTN